MAKSSCSSETVKAFTDATMVRAKAYAYIYVELLKEDGEKKADGIFSRAIYKLGHDKSKDLPENAKKDMKALAEEFIKDPVGREVFSQSILLSSDENIKIEMKNCPLADMWKKMGLSDDRILKLCDLAYQVDFGKIEGAGFRLKFDSRIAAGAKSCVLSITKK